MRPGSPRSPSARPGRHLGCLCPSGRSIFRPSMPSNDNVMEKLVSVAKRCWFVVQSSEIYRGLGWVWGYGTRGVVLVANIHGLSRAAVGQEREASGGSDAAILLDVQG